MALFLKLLDIRVGRCNRRQYWLSLFLLSLTGKMNDAATPALVLLSCVVPYLVILICARRIRDLNYSARLPVAALLALVILGLIDALILNYAEPHTTLLHGSDQTGVILKVLSMIMNCLLAIIGLAWIMLAVCMALIPGTQGQNKYGFAPIGFKFRTMVEGGAALTGNPPDIQAPWRTKAETGWQKSDQEPESN